MLRVIMQKMGLKNWIFLGLLSLHLAVGGVLSCSSDEKKSDTAEGAYAIAQEYDQDERWEEAIRRYNEVKSKFPYSKYATMAELAVADAYYKQESFPEAQVAYQNFKELHPKHPQIDYVTYRLGMSYFEQLPGTIDRDLTLAKNAIQYFDEVINQYPNSTHVKDAQEKKTDCLKRLGGKEEYIADFYFKKEIFDSALTRYEALYENYKGLGFEPKALSRAAQAAQKTGDLERAKRYLNILKQRYPKSSEYSEAAEVVR